MGKIRIKKSSRVHLKAALFKFGSCNDHESTTIPIPDVLDQKRSSNEPKAVLLDEKSKEPLQTLPVKLENNPFSGIKIKKEALQQKLVYTEPPNKPKKINVEKAKKKKDRIKKRREQLIKKLEVTKSIRTEEKKALKRAKTPVVGDLDLLKAALADFAASTSSKKQSKKNRALGLKKDNNLKQKSKKKQYHGLSDILNFQKRLNDNNKKDIKSLILQNIKEKQL